MRSCGCLFAVEEMTIEEETRGKENRTDEDVRADVLGFFIVLVHLLDQSRLLLLL